MRVSALPLRKLRTALIIYLWHQQVPIVLSPFCVLREKIDGLNQRKVVDLTQRTLDRIHWHQGGVTLLRTWLLLSLMFVPLRSAICMLTTRNLWLGR